MSIAAFGALHELAHVAFPVHLQVHADAPVKLGAWADDVDVRESTLDDFGQKSVIVLGGRDADFGVSSAHVVEDALRQERFFGRGELVEGVALFGVLEGNGNAGFGLGGLRLG